MGNNKHNINNKRPITYKIGTYSNNNVCRYFVWSLELNGAINSNTWTKTKPKSMRNEKRITHNDVHIISGREGQINSQTFKQIIHVVTIIPIIHISIGVGT